MKHELKIDKCYLDAKLAGEKLFEIRVNDRGYQKGDMVEYRSYPTLNECFKHTYEITYVTSYAQQGEYVVFGERHIITEKA